MNTHFFSTIFKTFMLACVSFAMASCSDNDELIEEQGGGGVGTIPIEFESSVAGGTWTPNTEVAIVIDGTVRKFIANGQGLLTPEEPLFWQGTNEREVEAWVPYQAQRPTRFTSTSDTPDFLYARALITPSESKKLEFRHQFAQIEVMFNTEKAISKVMVGGDALNLTADWAKGEWSNLTAPGALAATQDATNPKRFTALVIPQPMAVTTKFIHASVGGQNMFFALKNDLQLEAGNTYTFTLTPKDEGTNPDPQPEPEQPTLNADKAEIVADGFDTVTFSVTPETAKVVGIDHSFEGQNGATFTTTTPATYKFKAINDGLETAEVSVVAVAAPVLSVTPAAIKVGETATLKVMFKDTDRTADTSFTKDGAAFSGSAFTADTEGEFTFVAKIEGHKTNSVKVTVSPADKPEPVIPTISTSDATTITANGVDAVHFSVTPEGATLLKDGQPFEGFVFSSNAAGTFRFKAVYEGNQSVEEVVVTVNEVVPEPDPEPAVTDIPLKISADKYQILNNEQEVATITITCGDEGDVTTKAKVFLEDVGEFLLVKGNQFKIGPQGHWVLYAVYNGMTSNAIQIDVVRSGEENPNHKPAVLNYPQIRASKVEMTADGKDKVTFVTIPAEAQVVCETDGGSVSGKMFTTTVGNVYNFHAAHNGKNSASIAVKANAAQVAVSLTAAKTSLMTNEQTQLTVMQNNQNKTSVAFFEYPANSKVVNGKFSASVAGSYRVTASVDGITSNAVTIIVSDPDQPTDAELKLTADKYEIKGDGKDAANMTVMFNTMDFTNRAVFFVDGTNVGKTPKFVSTLIGEHKIMAKTDIGSASEKFSNTITIRVTDTKVKPTITANKKTIRANGTDEVVFTVTPGATIICDKTTGKLVGNKFTTTVVDTYTFKAVLNGIESDPLVIRSTAEPEIPMEGEVTIKTPSGDGAWENMGEDHGTIIL